MACVEEAVVAAQPADLRRRLRARLELVADLRGLRWFDAWDMPSACHAIVWRSAASRRRTVFCNLTCNELKGSIPPDRSFE